MIQKGISTLLRTFFKRKKTSPQGVNANKTASYGEGLGNVLISPNLTEFRG